MNWWIEREVVTDLTNCEYENKSIKKPILITGSHRSGTTWAGKILSTSPGAVYIDEPFNKKLMLGRNFDQLDFWYKYINNDNEEHFSKIISDIIELKYPNILNFKDVRNRKEIKQIINSSFYRSSKLKNVRPLLKDPIAFFSAPWLAEKFNMHVLVLIRHPAAFASSLKIMNWSFDFNNFKKQESLMENFLSPFKAEIEAFCKERKTIVDQAILLWNCIHHTVLEYQHTFPDWLFVRHEDLSTAPVQKFKEVFQKFGLTYTARVESRILETTGSHNAVEQIKSNDLKRNSKMNIKNWRTRLTDKEIMRVKRGTSAIAAKFYSEEEW